MPRVAKSCGGNEQPVEEDTQSFQTAELERPAPPPPPPGPPPSLLADVWPWLALLGILAVGGLVVWLVVFNHRHHTKHVVPAVVGLQQQLAVARLKRAGYSVKVVLAAVRKPAPRGVVTSQEPGGGSQLPTGSTVALGVSNGHVLKAPPPTTTRPTTASTTTTRATTTAPAPAPASQVPDVTGQDMAAGAGQVEAAGFVAETDPVQGSGTPGSIIQESPPGGTQGKAGETVTLGVAVPSSPPSVTIPDVTGKSAAEARSALLQAKLTVRTTYKSGKAGVVLGESPTGSAPAYTQVTITVGK
jgi:eukaryotic-like serine/threonine-protein kinase